MRLHLHDPHVMVDLETLSTAPDAAILSIGACVFTPGTGAIGEKLIVNIDVQSCIDRGMRVDAGALYWWFEQSDNARLGILGNRVHLDCALALLTTFVQRAAKSRMSAPIAVWSDGAAFDLPILRHAFAVSKVPCPWSYKQEMCMRTIRAGWGADITPPMEDTSAAHNALYDAVTQATYLSDILHIVLKDKTP